MESSWNDWDKLVLNYADRQRQIKYAQGYFEVTPVSTLYPQIMF
jgi:hypothetical protein